MPVMYFEAYNCAVKVYDGNRMIYSSARNYMSPNIAVREADIRMYNAKKRMKEA